MYGAKLAYLYEYPHDFTPYAKIMAAQEVGKAPTPELADALAALTGDPWSTAFGTDYTLYGAKVFYRGPNKDEFATNKRFKYVIGIQLSNRFFERKLYLVFNVLTETA